MTCQNTIPIDIPPDVDLSLCRQRELESMPNVHAWDTWVGHFAMRNNSVGLVINVIIGTILTSCTSWNPLYMQVHIARRLCRLRAEGGALRALGENCERKANASAPKPCTRHCTAGRNGRSVTRVDFDRLGCDETVRLHFFKRGITT